MPKIIQNNDTISSKKENKLLWLDLLRGITAFAVFIGHVRTLYFLDYINIQPSKKAQFFYFLTGFGHQSVIIFFVLSGFFIAKTMQSSINRHQWRFKDYFINRVVRLETVLIPALLLGFLFDSIGMKFLFYIESYAGKIPSLPNFAPSGKQTMEVFLDNVFFLQNIISSSFGSNAPLWSLANEFWYYMLYPLLYFCFLNKYQPTKRVIFALLALIIFVFIGETISLYFLIWLFGVGAFYLNQKYSAWFSLNSFHFKWGLFGTTILFLLIISLARLNILPNIIDDFILAFVSGLLILLLSMCSMSSNLLKNTATYLSNISYTLYLTHVPAAMLLCGLISNERFTWNFTNFCWFLFVTAILVAYSTLVWFIFERNTAIFKKMILQLLNQFQIRRRFLTPTK